MYQRTAVVLLLSTVCISGESIDSFFGRWSDSASDRLNCTRTVTVCYVPKTRPRNPYYSQCPSFVHSDLWHDPGIQIPSKCP